MSVRDDFKNRLFPKRLLLPENAKMTKIAFDVVRFTDGDLQGLWKVETDGDGKQYIVALYDSDSYDNFEKQASAKPWSVKIGGSSLSISYRGAHVADLSKKELEFISTDLDSIASYLPNALESNKKLAKMVLLKGGKISDLLNRFPELKSE